jgi:hypothetical protein
MHRGKIYFGRAKTLGGMSVSMTIPFLKNPNRGADEFSV